ncbi:MAG: radical SAM protein, partial [Clostridia bacterium]|nr:radical SAM protein [Clostridia bacterium]
AALYADGYYKPQTLDEAVALCSKLLPMFYAANIKVIRLGLHSIDEKAYVAGPWHPAFSELCLSNMFYNKALEILGEKGTYTLYVSPDNISKMIGQKRTNIEKLKQIGYLCKVLSDNNLNDNQILAERSE